MKTIAIFFATLVFSLTTISADAQNITTGSTPQIFQKIQDNLRVPESMKSTVSTERVCVVFTIDENGHAHVIDVASARPDIHRSVTSQFESIDFAGISGTEGQTYSIWLKFNVM